MRAEIARRLAALEARRRPAVPPTDPLAARFEAMTTAELGAWLDAYEPPPPADGAAPIPDFKVMTDAELDAWFAAESGLANGGAAR